MPYDKERRRDQLSITASILEQIRGKNLRRTQIMYRANLSFTQLGEYLSFSLHHGLISQSNIEGKEFYVITDKGLEYLQIYRELKKMINSKGITRDNQVDT
jgi:predicted transcriptional regulator